MIREDLNRDISAFQLGSPVLQTPNNSEKLLVIDLVVALSRGEVLAKGVPRRRTVTAHRR